MRKILAALCLLAAGCTPSLTLISAVDLAPMYMRASDAPLPQGLYCPVSVSWRPDNEIVSVSAGSRTACLNYSWDISGRLIIGRALEGNGDEPPQRVEIALAPLGDGLFIAQTTNTDGEGVVSSVAPYVDGTLLAAGSVYSLVPSIDEGALAQVFGRFPKIEFVPLSPEDTRRYIKSGAREDIAAALREAAALSLSIPDENGNMTLVVLTRVDAPAAEPVSSLLRRLDLASLRQAATRLAKQAPVSITVETHD